MSVNRQTLPKHILYFKLTECNSFLQCALSSNHEKKLPLKQTRGKSLVRYRAGLVPVRNGLAVRHLLGAEVLQPVRPYVTLLSNILKDDKL